MFGKGTGWQFTPMQHEHEHGYCCDWIDVVKMIISMKQYSATCSVARMTQLFVYCYRVCHKRNKKKKRKETKIVTDASSGGKKRRSKNWTRSRLCEDCELVLHGHKQQRRNSNHFFLMYAVYLWRAEPLTKVQRHRKKEGEEKRRRKKEKRKKEARTNKWEGNRNDTLLLLLLFTFVK